MRKKALRAIHPTWKSVFNPEIQLTIRNHSRSQPAAPYHSPGSSRRQTPPVPSPDSNNTTVPLIERDCTVSSQTVLQTCAAVRDQLPRHIPPVILFHQLYAELGTHSIDKELVRLCNVGALRKYRVGGGGGEFCLTFSCDYYDQIRDVGGQVASRAAKVRKNQGQAEPAAEEEPSLYDRFIQYLKSHFSTISVSKADLIRDMHATDAEINELFSAGFLTLKEVDTYWISVRNAGFFWTHFLKGRNEILQALKRRRGKDMLEREIEGKPLRTSCLSPKVILLNMLGKGLVERYNTPSGALIRLKQKTDAHDLKW
ncbi:serine-threonine protein kinase 19-domain-containing protein [Phlyctochytrium arcticum]|nr:serine-threonine protein kinase 19-domain-containing protein [Phlyctochytrium arcticum]